MNIFNRKIQYGWVIVFAAFTAMLTTSIPLYSFGVFIEPLTETFGWLRGSISLALAIFNLVVGFVAIFLGRMTDKYGVKQVMILGMAFYVVSLFLTSQINSLITFYLCFAGLGVGASSFYVPIISTVTKWFTRRRGLALGVSVTAYGVGMAFFSPLLELAISNLGWRMTFIYSGVVSIVLLTLSTYLMKSPPERFAAEQKYDEGEDIEEEERAADFTVGEALKCRAYWLIYFMLLFGGISAFFITAHIVPYSIDAGVSGFYAATLLTVIGLINIFGRVVGGYVVDKLGSARTLAVIFSLQAVSIFLIPQFSRLSALYLVALLFGLAYGSWAFIPGAISSEYFGTTNSGAILGTLETVTGMGGAIGPYFAGFVFDVTGTYDLAFTVAGFITVAAAALAVSLTVFFKERRVNLPEWDKDPRR
ncbi:MFS transporter [Candidatus Bipolaricaulota bacterium]|nr:MFS transporter [Candidatus Bipolaricaulota bacterium]